MKGCREHQSETYSRGHGRGRERRSGMHAPNVVDADRSENHPSDEHERSVQGHEVVVVAFALSFSVPSRKVDGRRTSISVGVLPHAGPLAVGVYNQGVHRVVNILSTIVVEGMFRRSEGV